MTTAAVPYGVSEASAYLPVVRALSLGASAVLAESAALNGASWGSPALAPAGSVLACFSADVAERVANCPPAAVAYVSAATPVLGTGGWVLSGPCDPQQLPSDMTPEDTPQQGCVGVFARVESSLLSAAFGVAGRIDAAEGAGFAATSTFGTTELLAPASVSGLSGIFSARVQQRDQGLQLSLRIPSLQVTIGADLGERLSRLLQLQTVDCCEGDYLSEGLAEAATASQLAPATFAVDGMQPMSVAIAEHGPALLDILARLGRKLPAALLAWISQPLADAADAGAQALLPPARVLAADAAAPAGRLMRGSAAAAVARKLQEAEAAVVRASVSTDDVAAALSSAHIFAAIDGLRDALREAAAGITGTASRAMAPAVQLLPEELRGPAQEAVDAVGGAGATAVDAVTGELMRALGDSDLASATLDYSQRCEGACLQAWYSWALAQATATRGNGGWAVQASLPANGPDGWRAAAKQAALDATAPGHKMQARMFVLDLAIRGASSAAHVELDVGTALGQTDALLASLLRVFTAGSGLDVEGTYPLTELATAGLHGVVATADALNLIGGPAPAAPPQQPADSTAAPSPSVSAAPSASVSVSPSVSPAASPVSAAAVRAAFQVDAVPLASVNSTGFVAALEASLQSALAVSFSATAGGAAAPLPIVYEIDNALTGAVLFRLDGASQLLALFSRSDRRLQAAGNATTATDATNASGSISIKVLILTDSPAGAASVLTALTNDTAALAGKFTAALQSADATTFANASTTYSAGSASVGYALPTPAASPSVSSEPSRSVTSSASVRPSMSGEPAPGGSGSEDPTPSASPAVSSEPSESISATASATETASVSPSASSDASASPSASSDASASPSASSDASASPSASSDASVSASLSATRSETATSSETPSSSESASPSVSPGSSQSNTASNTRSETVTPSVSPSVTTTSSETASETASGSATASTSASVVRSRRGCPARAFACRLRGGTLLPAALSRAHLCRGTARAQGASLAATLAAAAVLPLRAS
jgi:hypothetical protein